MPTSATPGEKTPRAAPLGRIEAFHAQGAANGATIISRCAKPGHKGSCEARWPFVCFGASRPRLSGARVMRAAREEAPEWDAGSRLSAEVRSIALGAATCSAEIAGRRVGDTKATVIVRLGTGDATECPII